MRPNKRPKTPASPRKKTPAPTPARPAAAKGKPSVAVADLAAARLNLLGERAERYRLLARRRAAGMEKREVVERHAAWITGRVVACLDTLAATASVRLAEVGDAGAADVAMDAMIRESLTALSNEIKHGAESVS